MLWSDLNRSSTFKRIGVQFMVAKHEEITRQDSTKANKRFYGDDIIINVEMWNCATSCTLTA